jgi:hypothetical protein
MYSKNVYFLFCLTFLFSSCCFVIDKGGGGVSLSIKEAKERNVFVSEYIPPKNPFYINDSIVLNVKQAWLEHAWTFGGRCNEKTQVDNDETYQLIIISDAKSLKGHLTNWRIGNTLNTAFFGTFENAIMVRFNAIPKTDTLKWQVHPGHQLDNISMGPIIGEFLLVRRQF